MEPGVGRGGGEEEVEEVAGNSRPQSGHGLSVEDTLLYVAASPRFEILPSAIVVILSSDSLGSQDINSVRKALDYSTCTIFIGGPSYKYN